MYGDAIIVSPGGSPHHPNCACSLCFWRKDHEERMAKLLKPMSDPKVDVIENPTNKEIVSASSSTLVIPKKQTHTFLSQFDYNGRLGYFPQADIAAEKSLLGANYMFANANGGKIIRAFLDLLPLDWRATAIIDTRVSLLRAGWYPCIPGWHVDNIARDAHGEPEVLKGPHPKMIGCYLTPIAPIEVLPGLVTLKMPANGKEHFKTWNQEINWLLRQEKSPEVYTLEPGILFRYGHESWHRTRPATEDGYRMWLRATIGQSSEERKVVNQIRNQVQCYVPAPSTLGAW